MAIDKIKGMKKRADIDRFFHFTSSLFYFGGNCTFVIEVLFKISIYY